MDEKSEGPKSGFDYSEGDDESGNRLHCCSEVIGPELKILPLQVEMLGERRREDANSRPILNHAAHCPHPGDRYSHNSRKCLVRSPLRMGAEQAAGEADLVDQQQTECQAEQP